MSVAPVRSFESGKLIGDCDVTAPFVHEPLPFASMRMPSSTKESRSRIRPEAIVDERFARDQVAVEVFEIDRLGADGKAMRRPSPVSCLEPRSLHSVGVGADIFLDQLRVGAEAAGGKNRRASAQFDLCAVLLGDQAGDAVVLDDEPHTFAAVQIASAEI